MSAAAIVRISLLVLEVALVGGLLILFSHALAVALLRRRRAPRVDGGRRAVYALMPAPAGGGGASLTDAERCDLNAHLARLSGAEQEEVIAPLARSLTPEACAPLRAIANEIGLLDRAAAWCRSRNWSTRLRGARLNAALCAGEDVMIALLRDRHPAVRAQAAEWAARHATPDVVWRLLEMIDDPDAFSRFAVQDALLRLGNDAVEPLARFLEQRDGPAIEPAIRVASALPHPRFLAAAIRHAGSDVAAVRVRAMNLLGSIGGSEVARLLVDRLGDQDAGVRAAAVRALGRIGHWPRAPEMAARMRDTSWDVRRAAGLALRDLGSPGILMLRRMTSDANSFAADMAMQVLDLPPGVGEGAS
jgi:HEAT repeat protein